MKWKTLVIAALFVCAPLPTHAITISQLVELLISLEIIAPDKVQLARDFVANQQPQGPDLKHNLYIGTEGEDVKDLQRFLRQTGDFTYPEITGYYGRVTAQAVERFQCREMNICTGSPTTNGYGNVGPQTRLVLRNHVTTPSPSPTPTCTPLLPETRTLFCAAGETGSITETRHSVCSVGATNPTWLAWETKSNTCTPIGSVPPPLPPPPTCTPLSPETRTLSCPTGQTGSISESRHSTCLSGAASPTWLAWTETSNTCSQIQTVSGVTPTDNSSLWQRGTRLLGNFWNMYNPEIVQVGGTYPYRMFFFGWASEDCNRNVSSTGCDAIFTARSQDTFNWEVYKGNGEYDATENSSLWRPVITSASTYYDEWHIGDPSVVYLNGVYYMTLSSTGDDQDGIPAGHAGDTDGIYPTIISAVSTDGINWQKGPGPTIPVPAEYGASDPLQHGYYHRPSLMYEDGKFRMWFDYWTNENGVSMGYAELPLSNPSTSQFLNGNWSVIHAGTNPQITQWPNPDVIKVGSTYYSYADTPQLYDTTPAGQWAARKITEATSPDGLQWTVTGYINPEPGCTAAHVPQAYTVNGELYVGYACQKGGQDPYGGPDSYNYRYGDIRTMKRSN